MSRSDIGRRIGETTRLIDRAVQALFQDGEVTFNDHYPSGETHGAAFRKLINRLFNEHGLSAMGDDVTVDYARRTIKLKS